MVQNHHGITDTAGQRELQGEMEEFPVEIKNLVYMKTDDPESTTVKGDEKTDMKKLIAQEAIREWQESVKMLDGRVERLTKWISGLTNEIFQIVGLYGLFVGVVFSIVQLDENSRVQCQHIGSPVALSLLVCSITFYVIDKKFMNIRCIRYQYLADREESQKLKFYLEELREMGHARFDIRTVEESRHEELESNTGLTKACEKEVRSITTLKDVMNKLNSNTTSTSPSESIKSLKSVVRELQSKTCVTQPGGKQLQSITRRLKKVVKDLESNSGTSTSNLKKVVTELRSHAHVKAHESYLRFVVRGILVMSELVLVLSIVHILCISDSPGSSTFVTWHDYAPGRFPY